MKFNLKGQTSTEYIIIIAVVILIAITVGSQLSDSYSVSSLIQPRSNTAIISTGNIAITKHNVGSNTSTFVIQNNNPHNIQLTNLSIDGLDCNSSGALPKNLRIGDSVVVNCNNINISSGDKYNLDAGLTYINSELDATYTKSLGKVSGVSINNSVSESVVASTIYTDDYLLYFNFDSAPSGTTISDSSTNSNDGTSSGFEADEFDATCSGGPSGGCYDLDGVDDYIFSDDSTSLDVSPNISISAWLKKESNSKESSIVSKGTYSLKITSDNRPYLEILDGSETISDLGYLDSDDDFVASFEIYNGSLFASIRYELGTPDEARIYIYNTSSETWDSVGGPSGATVMTGLVNYNNNLYSGNDIDGDIYRYDGGTTWTQIAGPSASSNTVVKGVFNNKLVVFDGGNRILYTWDGTSWVSLSNPSSGQYIYGLITFENNLYVASQNHDVYRFDGGTSWTNIQGDFSVRAHTLAVYDGSLFAGGYNSGPLKRYNGGTSWTQIGAYGSYVYAMAVYNDKLYSVHKAYNTANNCRLYSYDGSSWTYIGVLDTPVTYTYGAMVYDGKIFFGSSTGKVFTVGDGATVYSNTSINNAWKSVAGTYNGSELNIYINGVKTGSKTASITLAENSNSLLIGNSIGSSGSGNYGPQYGESIFNGSIDEVKIWNRSLNSSEVLSLYESP